MGRVSRSKMFGYLGRTEREVIGILLAEGPITMTRLGEALYARGPLTAGEARHVRGVVARLERRGICIRSRRVMRRSTRGRPCGSNMYVWLIDAHLHLDLPGHISAGALARLGL